MPTVISRESRQKAFFRNLPRKQIAPLRRAIEPEKVIVGSIRKLRAVSP